MNINKVPANKINPAQYNPRKNLKPGDPEYDKLSRSINEFDCVEPLVWNKRTGNLVGGHQRFKILLARGDKHFLCSVVDLSLEKEKTLNLALNKIDGDWDEDKLAKLLDELLQLSDLDFKLTGFELPEASRLIDSVLNKDDISEDGFDFSAELSKNTKPKTKSGEIIKLGPHRLMCGNSTKPKHTKRLLDGKKPDMIFTDPPYGIDYKAIKNRATIKGDNLNDLKNLLMPIMELDCKIKYICGHWKTFKDYIEVLGLPGTLIVWNKSQEYNRAMKGHNFHLYNPRHEFIYST